MRCRSRLATALAAVLVTAPVWAQSTTPKQDFVGALGRFSLALDARTGDEGPTIAGALDAMRDALDRWDAMIGAYEAAIASKIDGAAPELAARMHLALGGLYLDRHRLDDALRELTAARDLDPNRPDVHALLGVAYSQLAHDDAAAAEAFRAAAALEPGNPIRAYTLARQLAAAGREQESSAALRRFLESDRARTVVQNRTAVPSPFIRVALVPEASGVEPFFPPVRYAKGFALLGRGEYDAAIAALAEASAGDPLVADGPLDGARGRPHREAMARAAAAFRDGSVEAAVTELTAAIALAPGRAEPHRILGHVYAADRQFDAAIEAFRQAVALAPGDERARLGLADALVESGRVAAARDALHETLTVLPASGRARYALAGAYQRESRFEEALREFAASVPFQPLLGLNGLFQTIGSLHVSGLDLDAAIAAYSARVDLHPNDADAHYDLGDVYLRQNRTDEARAEFTLVLLLDPWHADAAASLAQTHLRGQDHAAAADAARRALELDPDDTEARYVLGTSLIRLGRAEDGRRELETLRRQQAEIAAARARILEVEGLRRDAAITIADGRFADAVALRRQVLALDPSAFSHLELGLALLDAGQPEEAIEQLSTAARLDGPLEVHRYLAEAYAAAGRQTESDRERAAYERMQQEALRELAGGR